MEDEELIYKNVSKDTIEFIKKIEAMPRMKIREQDLLIIKAQNGNEEAKNQIFEYGLKYVITVSKSLAKFGLPLEDLIQDGSFGLMKAIDSYKPFSSRQYFGRYATVIIFRYITGHETVKYRTAAEKFKTEFQRKSQDIL